MGPKTIIEEKKIEETIKKLSKNEFTVLDFIEAFRNIHPRDWKMLVEKFGVFGSKRRYTTTTYFSNRLDVYSQIAHSILIPFTRYSEGRFKHYRKTSEEERKIFGSPWIAVFKKKTANAVRQ
jgi:hypothetical protein